jgi:cobalt/nickel transport system permease protein
VVVLTDIYLLIALFAATIVFYAAGRLPLHLLLGWYTLPVLFVVTLAIMFVFTESGDPVVSFELFGDTVNITDNGIMLVLKLLLRALAVVTFSLAVFMTTRYVHTAHLATRLLPKPLAGIFLLSYRFNFETSDEMSDVMDAMYSRSGGLVKGMTRQTGMFASIFGLAFVHAFERAERISKAMEARGFSGEFPIMEHLPKPSSKGYALIVIVAALFAFVTYSRYVENLLVW